MVAVAGAEESALLGVAFWALRETVGGGGLFSVGQEILEGGGSGGERRKTETAKKEEETDEMESRGQIREKIEIKLTRQDELLP